VVRMRWLVGLVAIAAFMALVPGDALADIRFRGKSGQERLVTLRSDDAGMVKRFGIRWRAPCRRPGFRYTQATKFLPTYDLLTHDRFVDADSYRERFDNGVRSILSARVAGTRVSERRWRGIFRISARVFRGSRLIDRCYKRTRWRVARQG
jgi:hypothetical protein